MMKSKILFLSGILLSVLLSVSFINAQTNKNVESVRNDQINTEDSAQTKTSGLVDFSGEGTDEIFPLNGVWQAFGPYRKINVNDKQKVAGFGSAVFGMTTGTNQISISLCYISYGSSTLIPFSGNDHLIADVDASRRTFAVSASGTLPAGEYWVGYCVVNRGSRILDNNGYVNGWILITN